MPDWNDPAKRAEQLRKEIREHDRRYYDQAAPVISDAEYDLLFRELREIEDFVQRLEQAVRSLACDLNQRCLPLGGIAGFEQRERADNPVHRRANLVTHVGQERRLCATRRFRLLLRTAKL